MSSSWWANKLGTPGQAAPRPAAPAYTPQSPYPAQTPQPVINPELADRRLPASAASADRCPNCSSANYGRVTPESKARCYDCGYPIQQSGSGVPGVRVQGNSDTQAAKQISTQSNFNPGTIVDRIG